MDNSADGNPGSERNERRQRAAGRWRWSAGRRQGIDDRRIVLGHINHFRIHRLNLHNGIGHINHLLALDAFDHSVGDNHDLLLVVLEGASRLRFSTKPLDGLHQLFVLFQESLAQRNRPRQVVAHLLDHRRNFRDGFDVLIPSSPSILGTLLASSMKRAASTISTG